MRQMSSAIPESGGCRKLPLDTRVAWLIFSVWLCPNIAGSANGRLIVLSQSFSVTVSSNEAQHILI